MVFLPEVENDVNFVCIFTLSGIEICVNEKSVGVVKDVLNL